MKRTTYASFYALFLVITLACELSANAQSFNRKLLIIGVDGMSPAGLLNARTPNMHRLMEEGMYTLHVRAVMPTSSSSNWASMIMGAGPEQHGITSNDWQPDKFDIPPTVQGPGGIFPTLFSALRQQRPSAVIACFHDWDGFGRLLERNMLDRLVDADGPEQAVDLAIAYFKEKKPDLTFIQLDHVDHAGHEKGHGSPEYHAAVADADRLVGKLIDGLKAADMLADTVVMVAADHGGVGTKHGGTTMAELEVPWIIRGPGIAAGPEIAGPVNIYDIAPTAARILELKAHEAWIGRPIPLARDAKIAR